MIDIQIYALFFSSITLHKPHFIDLQAVISSNIRYWWDTEICNRCNQRLAKYVIPKCDPRDYKKSNSFVIIIIFFGFNKSKRFSKKKIKIKAKATIDQNDF